LLIIPVFAFRHYLIDGGKFPEQTFEDMAGLDETQVKTRAGILPYVTLALGAAVVTIGYSLAQY
jgi:hypothetical protein